MNAGKYRDMPVKEIVQGFEVAANTRYEALQLANSQEANKQYDFMAAAYEAVELRGSDAMDVFFDLLGDERSPAVRVSAASFAINIAPSRAIPVLERFSREMGFCGLEASMMLREWRKRN